MASPVKDLEDFVHTKFHKFTLFERFFIEPTGSNARLNIFGSPTNKRFRELLADFIKKGGAAHIQNVYSNELIDDPSQ